MSATWATVAGLAVSTAAIKAAGPLFFGGRLLPALARRVIPLFAPALLAALIVLGTFTAAEGELELDARAAGLGAAAAVLWLRRGAVLGAVLAAALVTALLRVLA